MKKAHYFLFLFLSITALSFAQDEVAKKWSKGFSVGFDYALPHLIYQEDQDNWSPTNAVGFRMGIFAELFPHSIISPRLQAEMFMSSAQVNHNTGALSQDIMPVGIQLSNHWHIGGNKGKSRPYFLVGPDLKIPLQPTEKQADIYYCNSDLSISTGLGWQFVRSKSTLAPEIRYSYGLTNVVANPMIRRVTLHQITLVVGFKN